MTAGFSVISIHAPHARSDEAFVAKKYSNDISIHAPHARSDTGGTFKNLPHSNFNPRSSCEERRRCLLDRKR